MKKLDYKPVKWEKRKAILIENSKYDYEDVNILKKAYLEGKIDEIRYHYTRALYLKNIAEDEFVQDNHVACNEKIVNSLNEFVVAIKLLGEGKNTNQATRLNIESKINSGYFGYYALIASQYDVISQITNEMSLIVQMLSGNIVYNNANDSISEMIRAIGLKDSGKFEEALVNRMKEIRKFNLDNYICADFIAIALIKEAKKAGMQFYSDYIEVDLK